MTARLWALSRGVVAAPPLWPDAADVSSGLLSTGFLHGQFNTTFAAASNPAGRAEAATRRFADHTPLRSSDERVVFHDPTCVPLVPPAAAAQAREDWGCAGGAHPAGAPLPRFVRDCLARWASGEKEGDTCRSAAELVNAGADFLEDFNVELAFACWRAVLERPAGHVIDDVSSAARDNLAVMTARRRKTLAAYLPPPQPRASAADEL